MKSRRRSALSRWALLAILALVAVACGSPSGSDGPVASASGRGASGGVPAGPGLLPTLPAGPLVRVERVNLSEDGRTVTMQFVGGKPFDATDPCSVAYAGFAAVAGDVLEVAVVETAHGGAGDPGGLLGTPDVVACDAMGYPRVAEAVLTEPFTGTIIRDLGGGDVVPD